MQSSAPRCCYTSLYTFVFLSLVVDSLSVFMSTAYRIENEDKLFTFRRRSWSTKSLHTLTGSLSFFATALSNLMRVICLLFLEKAGISIDIGSCSQQFAFLYLVDPKVELFTFH
ncbi:hypothetical protein CLIB1423_23S00650 [[Candida] railenensis]|uniref:Uncharacterized protein n=1 Tax=[Candida] railenensis TaxID=45579 RepID=A0A9P0W136_9ASCO|nr:hypothetical protein CLIB1423_23S00650 [[Candida] railenensis]